MRRLCALAVTFALAACSGGAHGPGTVPLARPSPASHGAPVAAALTVTIPQPGAGTSGHVRRPQFVAPTTQGILVQTYANNGGSPGTLLGTTLVDVAAASPLCTTSPNGSRTCAVPFAAPPGADIFVFTTYDLEPAGGTGGIGGTEPSGANVLGSAQLAQTIVAGANNKIGVSIGGVVKTLALALAQSSGPGAVKTFIGVAVNARDADGNTIVAGTSDPYANPITVSVTDAGAHTTLSLNGGSASASVVVKHSSDTVAATYDGKAPAAASPPYFANVAGVTSDGAATASTLFTPMFVSPTSIAAPLTFGFDGSTDLPQLSLTGLASQSGVLTVSEYDPNGDHTFTATAEPVGTSTCATVATVSPASETGTGGSAAPFTFTEANGGGLCRYRFTDENYNAIEVEVVNTSTGVPVTIPGTGKIQHVVVIVQENRSLNNLFMGFPGATTAPSGLDSKGDTVALQPVPLEQGIDLHHTHLAFQDNYDLGKMDGFDRNKPILPPHTTMTPPPSTYAYAYVPQSEIQPYWNMASQYTLADQMFESNSSNSFGAHQYLIAGFDDFAIDSPIGYIWGCDTAPGLTVPIYLPNGQPHSPGPEPCFDYPSLATLLDARGIGWRYYAPAVVQNGNAGEAWSAYDAIRYVRYGPDWTNDVISPETQVLSDVANGTLAPVTYVMPNYNDSDHAGTFSNTGPQWVANVVNAIGTSQFWNSTAILIVWDDWGGWYDPVAPPIVDVEGDGFRVPLIVVSPYAKKQYVSHVQYEFGSVLKYIEHTFGLGTLGTRDLSANDLTDCFDFSQAPSTFAPFATRLHARDFLQGPRTWTLPPDDN